MMQVGNYYLDGAACCIYDIAFSGVSEPRMLFQTADMSPNISLGHMVVLNKIKLYPSFGKKKFYKNLHDFSSVCTIKPKPKL